ncbi:ExbD/TolR family protein [Nubsella zeaxanthinifaciens]|uniref:ExbD/TolR family protein n=1 Tax=Nubsella zeaxanthinifaciens TaxID=392412 RepID=UPI000DE42B5F|nr:biopolymer transporter ExbD [Nubsella zeaxanthinifaciens]
MGKAKVKRSSTSIDMTAMCDVSFLLLTFFILTATARQPDPLEITTPSSSVQFKVPDKDISIVSIGRGKVFLEIVGQDVKKATLARMGNIYGQTFTEEEAKKFAVVSTFGVPFGNLKQFLAMNGEQRSKSGIQTGIPMDTTNNNELFNWIKEARYATSELHGIDMRLSIKGNAEESYPVVRKVVDLLQRQKINKFSLITTSE